MEGSVGCHEVRNRLYCNVIHISDNLPCPIDEPSGLKGAAPLDPAGPRPPRRAPAAPQSGSALGKFSEREWQPATWATVPNDRALTNGRVWDRRTARRRADDASSQNSCPKLPRRRDAPPLVRRCERRGQVVLSRPQTVTSSSSTATSSASLVAMTAIESSAVVNPFREPSKGLTFRRSS